jgi:hypothetical protein
MSRPRDDRDAVQDLARELADIAARFGVLKGEANAWLSDETRTRATTYLGTVWRTLTHRWRRPQWRRRVRLNEGREG